MQKHPYLTNFPLTFLATAQRSFQALQAKAIQNLRANSHLGSSAFFNLVLPHCFLRSISQDSRLRIFDSITVFWAWIWQILEGNASCHRALTLIQAWRAHLCLPEISSDTSSYCSARQRLKLDFLLAIHRRILHHLEPRIHEASQWRGFNLKAMDGSSIQLMDTPENQALYPQPNQQKKGCGFPVMGFVGLVNLSHGAWEHLETCPHTQFDSVGGQALIQHVKRGDILLADRAFCTYQLISQALQSGAQVVMRLHQARSKVIDMRKWKFLGNGDCEMLWKRPSFRQKGEESQRLRNSLPESLKIRIIHTRAKNREGKWIDYYIATTLLDPLIYKAAEIVELYMKRWDIELKIRDFKTTLRLEQMEVKTPEMAKKSLWVSVIAHNLLRVLMNESAKQANLPVRDLSFKGALNLLLSMRSHAHKRGAKVLKDLLSYMASKVVHRRPGRQEPRAVKRRPKPFQLLTKPRGIFVEVYHRKKYRKQA